MRPLVRRMAGAAVLSAVLAVAACSGGGAPPLPATTAPGESPPAGSPAPVLPEPEIAPTPAASLDLANADPLLTLLVAEAGDLKTGIPSLATGDFNNDGVVDLLIGIPFADGPDNERSDAGEVFVIFGRDGLNGEIDLATDEVGLHILGARAGDTLGFGVAGGDLNNDGVDDLIIGAPGSNGPQNERTDLGEAYVIFGHADLRGTVDILALEQDFTAIAAEGFARLGSSFAVADVNDDGISDLIAGAPFAGREAGAPVGGPRTTVGEVYILFGSSDLSGTVSVGLDQQDLTLVGTKELDAFGQAVAAGDVNGDGVADVIVGARGVDGLDGERLDAGAAFVFFGSAGLSEKLGAADADLTVLGGDPQDSLGDLAATGDLNGDGIADIALAARTGDGPENRRSNSGEVHVIFGGPSLGGALDLATADADAVIFGPISSGLMGSALVIADLNGEGLDDLAVGAALASGAGRPSNGMVYITLGGELPPSLDLTTEGDLFLYGAAESDALGSGLATGDIDADGRPELIVAASGAEGPGGRTGKIYALRLP